MDKVPAVPAADVTTNPWMRAAAAQRAETTARCAAAVAEARKSVQRALAAVATAQEHLRSARDEQQHAQERLRILQQTVSRQPRVLLHRAAAQQPPEDAAADLPQLTAFDTSRRDVITESDRLLSVSVASTE